MLDPFQTLIDTTASFIICIMACLIWINISMCDSCSFIVLSIDTLSFVSMLWVYHSLYRCFSHYHLLYHWLILFHLLYQFLGHLICCIHTWNTFISCIEFFSNFHLLYPCLHYFNISLNNSPITFILSI